MTHDICPRTSFCLTCGQSRELIVDHEFGCIEKGNVVAISHILSERKFAGLVGNLLEAFR